MESSITLFRRHETACTEHHPKEHRIVETDSTKRTGKAQCSCPIYAEGTLRSGSVKRYVRPKSTGCREWSAAKKMVAKWIEWGSTEEAVQTKTTDEYRLVTMRDAVETFIANQRKNSVGQKRIKAYMQLLEKRLLPFTSSKGLNYIQQANKAQFWSDFRHSWCNANPLRNRKPEPGEIVPVKELHVNTNSRMIGDLRVFIRFCVSREWLSTNWASKDHGMVRRGIIEAKEPFNDEEIEYIWRATKRLTDGRGFKVKRTDTENGKETLAFVQTMLYTGLRISDVTALEASQLVEFKSGTYTHAIYCNPLKTKNKKNGNWVHIPIPNGGIPGEPDLVSALKALPQKNGSFFFLGGDDPVPTKGTSEWDERIESGRKSWWQRLNKLFRMAERMAKEEGAEFVNHPHPHRFRHSFAATLLQGGTRLRTVAQYMGDTEETVRKHYSKFCVAEQVEAAKEVEAARFKAAEQRRQRQRSKMRLIR